MTQAPPATPRQMRVFVAAAMLVIIPVFTITGMSDGREFAAAARLAALGAVAGLLVWYVYHFASGRRTDGLFFLFVPGLGPVFNGSTHPLRSFGVLLMIGIPAALLAAG